MLYSSPVSGGALVAKGGTHGLTLFAEGPFRIYDLGVEVGWLITVS